MNTTTPTGSQTAIVSWRVEPIFVTLELLKKSVLKMNRAEEVDSIFALCSSQEKINKLIQDTLQKITNRQDSTTYTLKDFNSDTARYRGAIHRISKAIQQIELFKPRLISQDIPLSYDKECETMRCEEVLNILKAAQRELNAQFTLSGAKMSAFETIGDYKPST